MKILALCGSLRAVSSNRAALEACILLAPPGTEVTIFDGIEKLPHFNPDLDRDPLPDKVAELRRLIGTCDRLLISSPEYAHGLAGSLKNALDWLVGSLEFPETEVALINTSPRAGHAQAQLREVLTTMSAVLRETVTLPLLGRTIDAAGIAADPELSAALGAALT
jgi:NAD(P)H-dependent FMN reductase